ncbi:MAG: hypothetical protein ABII90_08990 [Bacteroidota bacterium]
MKTQQTNRKASDHSGAEIRQSAKRYWKFSGFLILGFSMLLTSLLYAKNPKGDFALSGNSDKLNNAMPYLVDHSAKYLEGNVYLKWRVKGQTDDCMYLIQRSDNGRDFNTVGYKAGIGSLPQLLILYCYIDKTPLQGTSYYRLMRIGWDLAVTYSDTREITGSESMEEKNGIASGRLGS